MKKDHVAACVNFELYDVEKTLLSAIGEDRTTPEDVARIYAFGVRSKEASTVNWTKVNVEIVKRWSLHALRKVKDSAWSGECFALETTAEVQLCRRLLQAERVIQELTKIDAGHLPKAVDLELATYMAFVQRFGNPYSDKEKP